MLYYWKVSLLLLSSFLLISSSFLLISSSSLYHYYYYYHYNYHYYYNINNIVDKTIFDRNKVSSAITWQLSYVYPRSLTDRTPIKIKVNNDDNIISGPTTNLLYTREIKCILHALSTPQPLSGRGYWISTSWVANAKKYLEAIQLPEGDNNKSTPSKKAVKIRQRRGSDALPPWPSMNADLLCKHGNLCLSKGHNGKRKIIDKSMWLFLRKFYPSGPEFSTKSVECVLCSSGYEEAKATEAHKREAEIQVRKTDFLVGSLKKVASRKNYGLPVHLLSSKVFMAALEEASSTVASSPPNEGGIWKIEGGIGGLGGGGGISISPESFSPLSMSPLQTFELDSNLAMLLGNEKLIPDSKFPLVPGLYNVLPRTVLQRWRQYTKDPSVKSLPELDCSSLLCHSHGLFVVPPHLEDYLIGVRKNLLGGLGNYPGIIVEILSAEEYDALQEILKDNSLAIRFCIDHGEDLHWNIGLCMTCAPFEYAVPTRRRRSSNRLDISF